MASNKVNLNWKLYTILAVIVMVVFATIAFVTENKLEQVSKKAMLDAEVKIKEIESLKLAQERELAEKEKTARTEAENQAKQIAKLEAEKEAAKEQVLTLKEVNAELESKKEKELAFDSVQRYSVKDLELGASVPEVTLSDSKLTKLFDGEVEFKNKKYDLEEFVVFSGLSIPLNGDEYNGEVFLEINEGGVLYKVVFDSELPLSSISSDDTLQFLFLGERVVVSSWSGDSLVFTKGKEVTLREGGFIKVDGKELSVDFIGEDEKVLLSYGGDSKTFAKGQVKTLGDLDVFVSEVLTNRRDGLVSLKVGKDVQVSVKDGDEFDLDKKWTWVIDGSAKVIGLVLDESFKGRDSDSEDFLALAYGDKFSLPNERVVLTFVGLDKTSYVDLKMDLATKKGSEYVRLSGSFESVLESYERVYVSKVSGEIFGVDRNSGDLELVGDRVLIKGTDFEVLVTDDLVKVVDKGSLVERAVFKKDFSAALLDGVVLSGDEKHISATGIRVSSVEDSDKDKKFQFRIPEEVVFANINFE